MHSSQSLNESEWKMRKSEKYLTIELKSDRKSHRNQRQRGRGGGRNYKRFFIAYIVSVQHDTKTVDGIREDASSELNKGRKKK